MRVKIIYSENWAEDQVKYEEALNEAQKIDANYLSEDYIFYSRQQIMQRNIALIVLFLCASVCAVSCVLIIRLETQKK
jgi:hypothetical protein